ncbi:MAG TPA: iron-containing alcohol dehydrogenase [Gammaproteobacteria bacterium]|nr:iron-containing alcohol dehydrogenase [Gammaproteobacteria bacterium]
MTLDITSEKRLQGNWNYPTRVQFGIGRIEGLPLACKELNMSRPLLVTDAGLATQPFIAAMMAANAAAGLPTALFSEVKSNPTGANIEAGVREFRKGRHDGVIAVGGGSGLDAGKAIALMSGQARPMWDFEDVGDNWLRVNVAGVAPCIAVPTTAGTGSEVGRAAVIVNETTRSKTIVFHPKLLPQIVIADPGLTKGLPQHITAATGMDAFAHNIEAYCVDAYHPMADGVALEGMRLIRDWLPAAFADGANLVARSHMLVASSMGAAAFQKGLGAVHALAHPLGALYDKHHGLLNAILLPYVLARNKPAIQEKMAHLARCLQLPEISFDGVMQWLLDLRRGLKIPHTLAEIGVPDDDAELIGEMALQDPSAGGNPLSLNAAQYAELFLHAVHGKA